MSNISINDDQQNIRGSDTNSLLRMYDLAVRMLNASQSQRDRERAEKAVQRIAKELKKRGASM
jgi:hypothetical protein